MNKQERKLKGLYKYRKRLANYRVAGGTNSFLLKTTGTPCSCFMCSPGKVSEKTTVKIRTSQELKEARVAAYEYIM